MITKWFCVDYFDYNNLKCTFINMIRIVYMYK